MGEGLAELGPVAGDAHDAVVDQLVDHYRTLRGEHTDWNEFRAAMVAERRLLVRLPLSYAYGWRPHGS